MWCAHHHHNPPWTCYTCATANNQRADCVQIGRGSVRIFVRMHSEQREMLIVPLVFWNDNGRINYNNMAPVVEGRVVQVAGK